MKREPEDSMSIESRAFRIWFIVCGTLSLGMLALGAWAVVSLVMWVTSK